jgi:predicted dehydrogenase
MTEIFRWGILGAAKIARTALAPAIQAAQGARLAALATRDPARAAPFRAMVPDLRVHADYDALLADPGIDAVYIPLPNHLHVDWCERALAAGKHVLCEKPIALNTADFDRLEAAQAASGRHLAEAFMVLDHPQWHRVRALLAEGAIGRLGHVDGVFTYEMPQPGNYRRDAAAGGGILRDVGVYPCITTRFATGAEPRRLRADIRTEGGIDTCARVWADFDGFTLSFHVAMGLHRHQAMVFHGTEGVMRLTAPFNGHIFGDTRIEWRRSDGQTRSESFNQPDAYRLMVEGFAATATRGAPPSCPLAFSRGNQAMIDGVLAAGALA